jgi:hypothetical protein
VTPFDALLAIVLLGLICGCGIALAILLVAARYEHRAGCEHRAETRRLRGAG